MELAEKFTETEIISKILNGEKQLYEIIIRRFNAYLYKIGRSYNYNHEDTRDLMQETFIDVYRSLDKFEERATFKTWIIRIMMNNCYRKRKKFSYKNEVIQDINENVTPMFTHSDTNADMLMQNRELGYIIEKALELIAFDYRMVFSLREINGLSVAETADLLSISESNVKVRLKRAKAMLRIEIRKSYSLNELFEFNLIYCEPMVEKVMKQIDEI